MQEPAHVPVWMATVGMTVHVSPQHLFCATLSHLGRHSVYQLNQYIKE